jgi:glycosyltransferase involved in cell wall biosynthesis
MVQQMASALPFMLYGGGNESLTFAGGMLSLDEQKKVLRTARAYFNANTHPASYTLSFIEAWMTGIPVVSVGPMLGNPRNAEYTQETFEVPDLITDGVNGYCSDDPQRLRTVLQDLLNDEALARSIGAAGRGRAIELFGIESVRDQWRQFLG